MRCRSRRGLRVAFLCATSTGFDTLFFDGIVTNHRCGEALHSVGQQWYIHHVAVVLFGCLVFFVSRHCVDEHAAC